MEQAALRCFGIQLEQAIERTARRHDAQVTIEHDEWLPDGRDNGVRQSVATIPFEAVGEHAGPFGVNSCLFSAFWVKCADSSWLPDQFVQPVNYGRNRGPGGRRVFWVPAKTRRRTKMLCRGQPVCIESTIRRVSEAVVWHIRDLQ